MLRSMRLTSRPASDMNSSRWTPQLAADAALRRLEHLGARTRDPARDGRLVDLVDVRDLFVAHAADRGETQQQSIAIGQRRQRVPDRLLELGLVAHAQVVDLGVLVGRAAAGRRPDPSPPPASQPCANPGRFAAPPPQPSPPAVRAPHTTRCAAPGRACRRTAAATASAGPRPCSSWLRSMRATAASTAAPHSRSTCTSAPGRLSAHASPSAKSSTYSSPSPCPTSSPTTRANCTTRCGRIDGQVRPRPGRLVRRSPAAGPPARRAPPRPGARVETARRMLAVSNPPSP